MKPLLQQPEWLRNMIYGYAEFGKWRILAEGTDFAIVQIPGGSWSDNAGQHYGKTSYYLVDKKGDPRNGHGTQNWKELQRGGRAGKKKLADWKALAEKSDALGAYADEETKGLILENVVDGLSVFLDTHLSEAQGRHDKGGMAMLGKSKDYWAGQIEAYRNLRDRLKLLVPGLVKGDNEP